MLKAAFTAKATCFNFYTGAGLCSKVLVGCRKLISTKNGKGQRRAILSRYDTHTTQ